VRGFAAGLLIGVLIAAGAAFAQPGTSAAPLRPSRLPPASPGGARVVVNGEWLYFDEYVQASGTVTITGDSGAVTLRKIPLGYALDLVWTGSNHAWVDAQITKTERRDGFSDGGD
jgi:hypothetical protein